jgi:hypothetical protein
LRRRKSAGQMVWACRLERKRAGENGAFDESVTASSVLRGRPLARGRRLKILGLDFALRDGVPVMRGSIHMRRLALTLSMMALLLASGCHNVTYIAKSRAPSAVQVEEDMNFFFWGLGGTGEVHTEKMCPTGVSKINTREEPLDVFLTIITLGIYSPRTAIVTCAR